MTAPPQPDVVLSAEGITKVFSGTVALKGIDFKVYRGKVNVLIGENGAGKSTLMKILAGVESATAGKLLLDGQEIHINSPREAAQHGIGITYQELNLFPNLNFAENIFMTREITTRGVINEKEQEQRARELLAHFAQPIDPRSLVGDLRVGEQQLVKIARPLSQNVRILIMDEPTSALSTAEVESLFRVIRELKAQGSVGSVVGLAAMIAGGLINQGLVLPMFGVVVYFNVWLIMLITLLVGVLIGGVNGWIITRLRVAPFIATLGIMYVARGFALLRSNGATFLNLVGEAELGNTGFQHLGSGSFISFPVPIWLMISFGLVDAFVANKTPFGRRVFAIGGNERAAELSGIRVNRIRLSVYMISGFCAAMTGLIIA